MRKNKEISPRRRNLYATKKLLCYNESITQQGEYI